MIPYLVCFFIVISLSWILEKILKGTCESGITLGKTLTKKQKALLCTVLSVLIIFLPAILAGLRDVTVGTDVIPYMTPTFEFAVSSRSMGELIARCSNSFLGNTEEGFLLIAFLISRFTDNIHWFLFFITLFITTLTFFTLFRLKEHCSLWLGETVFLFLCYGDGLNIARQCMALSVFLLSLSFVLDRKYLIGAIICILGWYFHRSILFAAFILMVVVLFQELGPVFNQKYDRFVKKENNKLAAFSLKHLTNDNARIIFYCLLIVLGVIVFLPTANLLYRIGILPEKYGIYFVNNSESGFIWKAYLLYLSSYLPLLFYKRKIWNNEVFLLLAFADAVFYLLQMWMPFLYRVSLYFLCIRILSLSQIRISVPFKLNRDYLCTYGTVILSFMYWFGFCVFWNNNEIVPYLFMWK